MTYPGFPKITSLNNLNIGETGTIIQVRGKPDEHRFLFGIGLAIGRNISVCATDATVQGVSLTVKSGDKISRLGNNLARNIKVKVSH